MIGRRPTPGEVFDELVQNPRRLGIAHACLGLAAAFVYWARPGTFTPHLTRLSFRDASPIYLTAIAWIPYLIAFLVSKKILANRSPKAVLAYIFLALVITVGASGLYLNLFGVYATLPPVLLAGGVTITLLAAVGLCATIWRSDIGDS
jgi:hypothetical protein